MYGVRGSMSTQPAEGNVSLADLRRVQRRREWPVRLMQAMQATQMATYGRAYRPGADPQRILELFSAFAPFKRLFGRIVGLGFRREHVETPDLGSATASLTGAASSGQVRAV